MPEPLVKIKAALSGRGEWWALRAGAMRVDPSQTSAASTTCSICSRRASTGPHPDTGIGITDASRHLRGVLYSDADPLAASRYR